MNRGPVAADAYRGTLRAVAETVRSGWRRPLLAATSRFQLELGAGVPRQPACGVHCEGVAWFHSESRARDDVNRWRRLVESPHDDIRLFLITELDAGVARRDVDRIAPFDLDAEVGGCYGRRCC